MNGAILLGTLAITLAGVEVTVRWFNLSKTWRSYHNPEFPKYREIMHLNNSVRGDYLWPDRQVVIRGVVMRTNRHGFRGPDYTQAKPPGTIRIACIGDSVTFGIDLPEEETYERYLGQRLSVWGRHVEVLNFGVPGTNLVQNLDVYFRKVPLFEPDVVILQFGLNDLPRERRSFGEPSDSASRANAFKTYLQNHSAGYLFVAERFNSFRTHLGYETQIIVNYATGLSDFEYAQRVLEPFLQELKSRGIVPVFAFFPYDFHIMSPRRELRHAPQVLREYVESRGALFVDLTEGLRAANGLFREVFLDEAHLTGRGNRVAAQILGDALEPVLLRQAVRPSGCCR